MALHRQHGWFTVKLPRYLAVQADGMAASMHLDEDIVHEVGKLGFPRAQLVQSLRRREQVCLHCSMSMLNCHAASLPQNKATVTYYLLVDNRRQLPGPYFREEMPECSDARMQHPTGTHQKKGLA